MSLLTLDTPEAHRTQCDAWRAEGLRVGLVPTMGALHDGHVALVEEAVRRVERVVVSIFVNPTQFGPGEDLARYPRTLDEDRRRCEAAGAAAVFVPAPDAMYPPGDETRVRVGAMAADLCGRSRPVHFEGVATVVSKLFVLTGACVAVFGRKDYQQLQVVKRLVTDLFLPVEVVGLATVREPDGVALSSRNAYLDAEQRLRARALSQGLSLAHRAFAGGERRAGTLRAMVEERVAPEVDRVDYVTVADADTVAPLDDEALAGDRALLAVAAHVGPTRLIDNVVLGEDTDPRAG